MLRLVVVKRSTSPLGDIWNPATHHQRYACLASHLVHEKVMLLLLIQVLLVSRLMGIWFPALASFTFVPFPPPPASL